LILSVFIDRTPKGVTISIAAQLKTSKNEIKRHESYLHKSLYENRTKADNMGVMCQSSFNLSNTSNISSTPIISTCIGGGPGLFPSKLHDLLDYAENNGLGYVIEWASNGRSFIVHDPEKLSRLLPLFFGQTKYRSFQRQLHMWNFEKIHHGSNRGARAHPYFIRGQKSVLQHLTRDCFKRSSSSVLDDGVGKINSSLHRKPVLDTMVGKCTTSSFSSSHSRRPSGPTKDKTLSNFFDSLTSLSSSDLSSHVSALIDDDEQQQDTHVQTSQDQQEQQHHFEEGDPVDFEGRQFFFLDLNSHVQRMTQNVKQQQQQQQQEFFTMKDEMQDFGTYPLVDLIF
jgi:HSF-type DNA-binding